MQLRYPLGPLTLYRERVSDPHPRSISSSANVPWYAVFLRWLHRTPQNTDELLTTLSRAEEDGVIDTDARVMVEGVMRMSRQTAGDVMVAAPRMDLIAIDASPEEWFDVVIDTAHSRFPVYEGERDHIIGILLAKDLLKLKRAPDLSLRSLLRPATFVPESKRLNDLLRDFRKNRNHLAMVVDEFGQLAGLVTIEDVLEEIVGEIEDEFDDDDDTGDIYRMADKSWRVSGNTALDDLCEAFGISLDAQDFETIGGWIAHHMGQVPKRGEFLDVQGLRFAVMHARGGAVRWFKVTPVPEDERA